MLIGGEFGSFPIKNVVLWEEAFISDTLAPKSAETLIKVVFNVLNRTGKKILQNNLDQNTSASL